MAPAPGPHVLLYDGVCGLCDRVVRFVLPRDRREAFRFAPIQSAWARERLRAHRQDPDDLSTFWVLRDAGGPAERALSRAEAFLFLARTLGLPWSALSLLGMLPRHWLDAAYDRVARMRYRVFGRRGTCRVPPEEWRRRFVEGAFVPPSSGGA